MSVPTFQQNLINILGENVSLTPTGLAPTETVAVDFDSFYVPEDIEGDDILLLKNTMRQLFENKLKKVVNVDSGEELDDKVVQAYPPCGEDEKAMVLKSLIHRKAVLEQQLYNIGIRSPDEIRSLLNEMAKTKRDVNVQGKDNMLARQYLSHYVRLKRFINNYEEQQYCIYLEDLAYGETQRELTDDMVKELLKQFIFFVLQSHHPLDDYKKTDPTASAFVSRLERKPLRETFDSFLQTYGENELPIPPAIAAVLEATDMSPDAMEQEIKTRVKKMKDEMLKRIISLIPLTEPFWKRVREKQNLDSVMDALIQYPKDLLAEILLLEREKASLGTKSTACEQAKQLLENQVNSLNRLVSDLKGQLAKEAGKDTQIKQLTSERDAAVTDLRTRQAALDAEKNGYLDRIKECEAKITRFTQLQETLSRQVEALQTENERYKQLEAKAQGNIKALQAELAEEKLRVQEQTTGRLAAEAATKESKQQLSDRIRELAEAQVAIEAHKKTIAAQQADAAASEKLLGEKENLIASIRSEIQEKKEAERLCNEELAKATAKIQALQSQLDTLLASQEESKEEEEARREETDALRVELAKERSKVTDIDLEKKALKKQIDDLRGSVSATSSQVAELTSQKQLAEDRAADAIDQRNKLDVQIKTLQAQLADSQEATNTQTALVAEKEKALKAKDGELEASKREAATQERRATEAEAKVDEITAEKDALGVSMTQQVKSVEEALGAKYQEELARAKQRFDEALAGEQASSSAELEKTKAAHELLRQVVLAVASEADPRAKVAELGDVPERASLETIINRLAAAASKPASPLAALAEQKREASMQCYYVFLLSFLWQSNFPSMGGSEREKTILDFFGSVFTTGFEPKNASGTRMLGDENKGLYAKLKEKAEKVTVIKDYFRVIQTLARALEAGTTTPIEFTDIKDAGKKATEEAKYIELTKKLIEQIDILSALYTTAGKFPPSPTPPPAVVVPPSTQFQKQAQATIYETYNENEKAEFNAKVKAKAAATGKAKLSEKELDSIFEEMESFSGSAPGVPKADPKKPVDNVLRQANNALAAFDALEPVKTTGSASGSGSASSSGPAPGSVAPGGLVEYVNQFLKSRQPTLHSALLKKRIVADASGIHVGESGNLNYTVLFYCFLMLLRDYLNSIENTGDQCRLPTFLKTSGK